MGAVQKLATTVIVGLVGLATLLVVYLADEPNRRHAEAEEQQEVAIERGIQTYLQNCVACHGPAGEGYSEPGMKGTGRVGMPLGGSTELGLKATENNQTGDAMHMKERHDLIVKTLNNGRGLMPAFGTGAPGGELLNQEQIYELAAMIQHVDWNLVYNDSVLAFGGYPTPPPPPAPAAAAAPTPAPAAGGDGAAAQAAAYTVTSHDIYFDPAKLTIPADTEVTVSLPNAGAAPHNFSIDALKISVDQAPGETKETKIKAAAGDYEYYCNVPGHKEAGMVGTLTADPNAKAPEAAPAADAAAAQPAEGSAAPAAAYTVTSHDIYFDPKELTVPADQDVTISLPNQGAAPHNFSIDALNVSVDMAPGETKDAKIKAAAGDYEYYCNIPGHKEAGMVGKLTASADAAAPAAAPAEAAPADAAAQPADVAASAAQEFTVTSHDIYFEPKELEIPAATDVKLVLPNQGAAPHNFSIDALKISVDQAPGETKDATVNAPAGEYEYYCNVPGHKEAGMVGKLTAK